MHNGYRAIDKAQDYEKQIQNMYGGAGSQSDRSFQGFIDGLPFNGIADNVVDGVVVEAKYVDDWDNSLRNPANTQPWALKEQQNMINQAKKYSDAFDEVVYHTNSQELIDYYSKLFSENGLSNIVFKNTPSNF